MNALVDIVMFGWIPVVLVLCATLPTRRAVVAAFVIAWSFLPLVQYHIEGFPAYSKMSATCGGVLLGALLFDIDKLLSFRPSWLDVPMLVWCLCPCIASLTNGLGLYDGISGSFAQTVTWGFPYFIGRLYLGDISGIRELAAGILMGGVIYVPLCLFEVRMSPQLHRLVYGFQYINDFTQTMRFGGWRPTVFMDHGLMVGMWMSMAAMVAIWAWWTGSIRHIFGIPISLVAPVILITAILCKSTGALLLLVLGLGALWTVKRWGTRFFIWVLIAAAPIYIGLRVTRVWDGTDLADVTQVFSAERSQSFEFRLFNENLLIDRAMLQPIFGWGGWGRNQIINKDFRTVVDGQWIDSLGKYGIVGLTSLTLVLLLPAFLVSRRFPAAAWSSPVFASAAAMLMINVLYMLDNIPNAMVNPIYVLAAGGLTGILAKRSVAAGKPPLATVPMRGRVQQYRSRNIPRGVKLS